MDIKKDFGRRIKELRARAGISQEVLAYRAELDRGYISSVESGHRNISLVNIEKIAIALNVPVMYLFSNERFSIDTAYQKDEFNPPFNQRFKYHLDTETRVLSFQVKGLFSGYEDVEHVASAILSVCSEFQKGELSIFVDHRFMTTSDGMPAVYSPEVAEHAVKFQQDVLNYSNKAVVLCNSEYMVHQLNYVTEASGISSCQLYDKDQVMVDKAYEYLGINGNELIKYHRDCGGCT
ncbi:helix-turn-helix domain-containing protein [Paenibacillus agilis]|uniref:Helix-turn-helix transcriptional regulator n=1 Tax=Paenibacillus agilis TaxID=3020863 RepID=A0A559J0D0_9BACL|nr:helix-turn-helix transcriptional regulator [Paenibacillus agilis]TVX93293.1 helix-turn-helix transcriptional regulator [Paenibacillus agilis]